MSNTQKMQPNVREYVGKTTHSSWLFPKGISAAKIAQKEMAEHLILEDVVPSFISYIAGIDVSANPFDPKRELFGAVVVLSYPALELVEVATHVDTAPFPYIPGLLGFRETPIVLEAYQKLSIQPDLLLVDGHGICHPRGLGIASHIGVILDKPTIGVAKSLLVGAAEKPISEQPGSSAAVVWKGKAIGILLRTKKRCLPLIISPGHKISAPSAVRWTQNCLKGYRLPEPTRQAHLASNRFRKDRK